MLLEEFDRGIHAVINPDMVTEKIEDFPVITIVHRAENVGLSVLSRLLILHRAALVVSLNPVYDVEYKGKRFAPFDGLFICHGMVLTNS